MLYKHSHIYLCVCIDLKKKKYICILGKRRLSTKQDINQGESSDKAPSFPSGIETSPLQTANEHIQDKTPVDI